MAILSYHLSERLKDYLATIEKLRQKILLFPLNPKEELRLKWEMNLQRIFWAMSLIDNPLNKSDVIKLLSTPPKKKLNNSEKDILNQRNAMNYLKENWLVSTSPITINTIRHLYDIACKETSGAVGTVFNTFEKEINLVLEYLQTGNENPIIQAGIAEIQISIINPFTSGNGRMARLMPYLFLYKYGYDFREMLNLEEFYRRDLVAFRQIRENVRNTKNLTLWLEYFTFGIITQLKKAIGIIEQSKFQTDIAASFWRLNDRQKQILLSLEQPGARITNKNIQKNFGVSQITASRELAKLVNLGLLFPHGKGRSVYYTKV
jgi:Fic family protein